MWRVFVVVFIYAVISNVYSQPLGDEKTHATNAHQNTSPDMHGTGQLPLVVKVIFDAKSPDQLRNEDAEKQEHSTYERRTANSTIALAWITGLLAFATCILAAYTYKLWNATNKMVVSAEESANNQFTAMQKSIGEAVRTATAMENVAEGVRTSANAATESVATLKEVTSKQMRAYLTVVIGSAIYQERTKGLKFEARPRLINTGHTPAHKVKFKCNAAVLPVELPEDFSFPLPSEFRGGAVLGPNQFNDLSAVVDDFLDDQKVETIKQAKTEALYVWGTVTYEDVFGIARQTRYCQTYTWLVSGDQSTIYGYYNPRHNDAT